MSYEFDLRARGCREAFPFWMSLCAAAGIAVSAWGAQPTDETAAEGATSVETTTAEVTAEEAPAEVAADPMPAAADTPFIVGSIDIVYDREHPGHPPAGELLDLEVMLTPTAAGYVGPVEGSAVPIRIADLTAGGQTTLYASALQEIFQTIALSLNQDYNLLGVFVGPNPGQIQSDGLGGFTDLRDSSDSLSVVVQTAIVTKMTSVGSGTRLAEDAERIDSPVHARILRNSPVQVWGAEEPAEPLADGEIRMDPSAVRRDLINERELEEYALRLSRHPGRRVDVALAPGEGDFAAELQYLVRENRPWYAYYQLSNTGTENTDEWRNRFGVQHSQLFGLDDVASLEYVTAGFDESHSIVGSYGMPLFGSDRVRWNVSGGWNEFNASDVGALNETFTGESWFVSGEVAATVFQRRRLFVDLIVGARYQNIEVTNEGVVNGTGEDAIFLPRAGLRMERVSETSALTGSAIVEWTENEVSGASFADLQQLGRLNPDTNWVTFQWDTALSVYLEPLIWGDDWNDPDAPGPKTRAHELVLRFGGQYGFNNRLIPNAEQVLGGLYSVRGYPESVVAGDTMISGSAEYRFHVPRAFKVQPEPRSLFGEPFRVAPQRVYGEPDWDLILMAFFDIGKVYSHQQFSFERDETLMSTGVGAEVQIRRNVSFRTDWGIVLDEIGSGTADVVTTGSQRWHFVLTVLY